MQNTPDPRPQPCTVLCPSPAACSLPGAAGGAALSLPLPEPLPVPAALPGDAAGLGPGTGLGVGLRADCALLVRAHAHGECCLSPGIPALGLEGQGWDTGERGRDRPTAALLLAWHLLLSPRTLQLAANSCALTPVPAHQVQQEQQAQGSARWKQEIILLVLPFMVSLLNALMPHLFNLLALWEKQDSPMTQVSVAIFRWAGWGCGGGSVLHLGRQGGFGARHPICGAWPLHPLGSGTSGTAPTPQEPHPEDDGSHPAVLPVAQPEH